MVCGGRENWPLRWNATENCWTWSRTGSRSTRSTRRCWCGGTAGYRADWPICARQPVASGRRRSTSWRGAATRASGPHFSGARDACATIQARRRGGTQRGVAARQGRNRRCASEKSNRGSQWMPWKCWAIRRRATATCRSNTIEARSHCRLRWPGAGAVALFPAREREL